MLRLAVVAEQADGWSVEAEVLTADDGGMPNLSSMLEFRARQGERTHEFNTVMVVPTGIDCAIGGHAGDATAAARLLATVSDQVVVHPNVVNASDINEQPANALYVEGSIISRLLMGSVALRKVRKNRILFVTEPRDDGDWVIDQLTNTVGAARATLGVDCPELLVLNGQVSMLMEQSPAGRAVGEVSGLEELLTVLQERRATYDAVAISTMIAPAGNIEDLFQQYFEGEGPNPWGGVEAAITHSISNVLRVPSAHAPTLEDLALRTHHFGPTDPRKAAEAISMAYSFCLMKGLHQSPAIVEHPNGAYDPSCLSAEDISCLVVPDGCIGLPTLAALWQGIPVIAVRENTNRMKNTLSRLPFASGQLHVVESYLEAAGVIAALKSGIHVDALRRPLVATKVHRL
ncbi:MAG: DUF3326 domain-containing protein [Myxococcota bacterium]